MAEIDWSKGKITNPDAPTEDVNWGAGTITPPPKPVGAIRKLGDLATGFGVGAIGATKAIADAAGAGNKVSGFLESANKDLSSLLSPQAIADQQEQAAIQQAAAGKGPYEEFKAGVKAFGVAPVQTTVGGVGSMVPILGAAALGGLPGAAAAGASIGAGTVKGAIYDDIKARSTEKGLSAADAESAATKAQEYDGKNIDQIALGAGLGVLDSATGASGIAGGMVRKAMGKPVAALAARTSERGIIGRAGMGMLEEMPVEFSQGAQERVAANLAAQREGYQAGTWDNAVSGGTLEALASAGPGAGFGIAAGRRPATTPPPEAAPATDATPGAPPASTPGPQPGLPPDTPTPELAPAVGPLAPAGLPPQAAPSASPAPVASAAQPGPSLMDSALADARDGIARTEAAWAAAAEQQRAKRLAAVGVADPAPNSPLTNAAIVAVDSGAHDLAIGAQQARAGTPLQSSGGPATDTQEPLPVQPQSAPNNPLAQAAQTPLPPLANQQMPAGTPADARQPASESASQPSQFPESVSPSSSPVESPIIPPTQAGYKVQGVDEAIQRGASSITVSNNGQPVPFNTFVVSVEGDTAQVASVERASDSQGGVKGSGFAAYIELGNELAARGVTLTNGDRQNAPGAKLWRQLAEAGYARRRPSGKGFEFIAGSARAAPAAPQQELTRAPEVATGPARVLQNRDRSTAASISQMNNIAKAPDYLRAGQARVMENGAPVVFGSAPAGALVGKPEQVADATGQRVPVQYAVVEADDVLPSHQADGTPIAEYEAGVPGKLRAVTGNGRAAGISEGYRRNTATQYRQDLTDDAENLGIDPAAVAAMRAPVLVRVMPEELVTDDIGDRSNIRGSADLSPAEQATNDTRRIDIKSMEFDESGMPDPQSIARFVQAMSDAELNTLVQPDGITPTRQLIDRITSAAFKAAYGNDEVVRLQAQSTDTEIRNIITAMASAAGPMANLEGAGDFDIRGAVAEAAQMAVNAKRSGIPLTDYLNNADINFSGEAFTVAKFMADNIRSAKRMAEGLRAWADYAAKQVAIARENETQGAMFGPTPTASRGDTFNQLGATSEQSSAAQIKDGNGGPSRVADRAPRQEAQPAPEQNLPGDSREKPSEVAQAVAAPAAPAPSLKSVIARMKAEKEAKAREAAAQKGSAPEVVAGPTQEVQATDSDSAQIASAQQAQPADTLTAPTPDSIIAQQDRAEVAAQAEKSQQRAADERARRERERKDIAKASEAAADTFTRGGDAEQNLSGQGSVFDEPAAPAPADDLGAMFDDIMTETAPAPKAAPKPKAARQSAAPMQEPRPRTATQAAGGAAKNTAAALANAIDGLGALFGAKSKGRIGSGLSFDEDTYAQAKPLFIQAVSNLKDAAADIREAMRAVISMVTAKFGRETTENMKPYIVRFAGDVRDGTITQEELNAASTNGSVERDSAEPAAEPAVGNPVPADARGAAGRAGQDGGSVSTEAGRGQQDRASVPFGSAPVAGERGDQPVSAGNPAPELANILAGSDFREPGGDSGIAGVPPEPIPASAVAAVADAGNAGLKAGIERARADKAPVKLGDIESIRATLPQLLSGQQDDVLKAEQRFAKPDGYGMLFTNGTGTGKTFTGLGIVKRFARQGKTNILIAVPDDKIAADWIESGKVLGLEISKLKDIKDAGSGIVITSYANMGANDALATRQWDAIVADEAHTLAQDKDGTPTTYLHNLRAITHHPDGAYQRYTMLHRAEIDEMATVSADLTDAINWVRSPLTPAAEAAKYEAISDKLDIRINALKEKLDAARKAVSAEVDAKQGVSRARLVALSATPFAYEKTIDWANGYLFDYNEGQRQDGASGTGGRSYNSGSNRERFFMRHFGYSMRYNKLTAPDAKVDSGLMQRQFNTMLKKSGALSGRMLDVKPDYDRRFVLVDSAIGNRIDEALSWLSEKARESGGEASAYAELSSEINERFGYLQKRYLLEAIKATEVIPIVKKHLAMGRKVVVFHDYKQGGGFNPFTSEPRSEKFAIGEIMAKDARRFNAALAEFNGKFSELVSHPFGEMTSPVSVFKRELPGTLLVNGDEKKADLLARYKQFQDDATGPQVMLVQSAKNKGWSGHDATGKHQRVLINLGQPTAPTLAIQQEGRIYRTGQASDAIMRYLNTGTNWERWAFATTIAGRASTAENLGMGESARALKDSFIQAFEESDTYAPGHEGEGKGGKERDKAANNALSEYDRAKTLYWANQKKTARAKAQEGIDYFATPEPVGLKMVQWLDARSGEDLMEPSGGHGAIARWLPERSSKTVIEPSTELRSRLALVMNATEDRIIAGTFEDHAIQNKYDGIAMNPPFGTAGRTAIDHLAKAATHLRDGGRIVAIIPTGPAADAKFDKWFYEVSEKPAKPLYTKAEAGPIYRGDTVFYKDQNDEDRRLVVDKTKRYEKSLNSSDFVVDATTRSTPYGNITRIEPGYRTEEYRPAADLYTVADIKLPSSTFERAGTSVMTRIVVIEKQSNQALAPQPRNIDLTSVKDIAELFDRLEDLNLPARPKVDPVGAVETKAPAKTEKPARAEKPMAELGATVTLDGKPYTVTTYTTNAGKVLRGAWLPTKPMAERFGSTFQKRGEGWFVRESNFPAGAMAPAAPAPAFSRAAALTAGMTPAQVQAITDRIAAKWTNAPEIIVAANMADPRIPQAARDEDQRQRAKGAGNPEGFVHGGTVYLLADNIPNAERAAAVLLHETIGHIGLQGVFGDSLKGILQQIATMRRADVTAKAKQYGLNMADPSDRLLAAEEVLAEMSQTTPQIGFVRRAVAAIRNWLRVNIPGFKSLGLTDADIAQAYLLPARGWIERGAGGRNGGSAAFSRGAADQTDTPAFRAWFGDSKVMDAEGRPMVVYHGTPQGGFSEFDPAKLGTGVGGGGTKSGFFFAASPRTAGAYAGRGSLFGIKEAKELFKSIGSFVGMNGSPLEKPAAFTEFEKMLAIADPKVAREFSSAQDKDAGVIDAVKRFMHIPWGIGPLSAANFLRNHLLDLHGGFATAESAAIYPVYLSIKNPIVVDMDGRPAKGLARYIKKAKDSGSDGVIFKNFQDGGEKSDHYFAFNPEQIKSAIGNNGSFDGSNPDIRFSRGPADIIGAAINATPETTMGDTGRYDAAQVQAMRNIGATVTGKSIAERTKEFWKDAGKKLAQGLADQFAPIKEISAEAYGLLRLSKGASGAFETLLNGGMLKLSDNVYNFDEANRGGVTETLLTPLQGEHHDFLRWVAANRAERLMNESEATRAEGAKLLTEADRMDQDARALDAQAKQYLQQAGNFPKSMTGNQQAQRANAVEANKLMAQANKLRTEAAGKRKEGNEKKNVSRENLFTRDDIAALKRLADGPATFDFTIRNGIRKGVVTRDRAEIYRDSLATFNAFNKNVLDMAEQSGLIDPESRKIWESEFYVPFYRVADESDGGVRGMNVGSGVVRQQAFKELKGGRQKLNVDLLDNTLMNWAHLLDAGAKNRAARATLEAAEKMGIAIGAPESTVRGMAGTINKKNNVVWFMDGGKQRYFLVDDPYVMTAISALEYAGMRNPAMNAMGAFKHVLTVGVTASPFFKIRNLIRDSVQVVASGQIGYNPAANIKQGWKLTDPKSDAYFRLLAGGGTIHFGTMMEGSESKRVQALIESGVRDSSILDGDKKVKAFYRRYIEPGITAYNELGNRGEAINRAALYDQLIKQGVSHADASLQARDLMDFSMQGSFTAVRFLTQVVPFMNARIQGLYKLGRAAKEDPRRMAVVIGAVAAFSVALLAAYSDDDDWKKREEWDRNNFWWFKFGGEAFRIPKPFEVGAIGTLAERGFELAFDDEMTGARFKKQVLTLLGDNLSMNPVPQMFKPIIDVYSNKNSFTGRPLESMGMERLKPEYRFNGGTSMTARAASTALNSAMGTIDKSGLSPVQIDHMLRSYFGWLGSFVIGTADLLARPATGQAERATPDYWKMATGSIVSGLEGAQSRYVSSMYDQAARISQDYNTWRTLLQDGKTQEAQEFRADHAENIGKYRKMEAAKSQTSELNQQIKRIEQSGMTGDEKRAQITRLRNQQALIARMAVRVE